MLESREGTLGDQSITSPVGAKKFLAELKMPNAPPSPRYSVEQADFDDPHEDVEQSRLHTCCKKVVIHPLFDIFIGIVTLSYLGVVIVDTDTRAQCRSETSEECASGWSDSESLDFAFLAIYIVELCLRIFVSRCAFFYNGWNTIDFAVVGLSVLVEIFYYSRTALPSLGYLRLFRVFRLMRSARICARQRELYMMLHGFVGTIKALFWASLLMFGLLTMWSILAVEVLHPLNLHMAEQGVFSDCDRCKYALRSVFEANLTFFRTVVMADNWGELVVPFYTYYPWTLVILMGVTFTVGLGLTNLILAAIVDIARDAHEQDVNQQRASKEVKFKEAKGYLRTMCEQMDADNNGTITMRELLRGYDSSKDFRSLLDVLDIEKDDLQVVFKILDADRSGSVSYEEFVENLYRLKSQSSRTLLVFIKFYVLELREHVKEEMAILKGTIKTTLAVHSEQLTQICRGLNVAHDSPATPSFQPLRPLNLVKGTIRQRPNSAASRKSLAVKDDLAMRMTAQADFDIIKNDLNAIEAELASLNALSEVSDDDDDCPGKALGHGLECIPDLPGEVCATLEVLQDFKDDEFMGVHWSYKSPRLRERLKCEGGPLSRRAQSAGTSRRSQRERPVALSEGLFDSPRSSRSGGFFVNGRNYVALSEC